MADIIVAYLFFLCLLALAGIISLLVDIFQELQKIRHILERWSR